MLSNRYRRNGGSADTEMICEKDGEAWRLSWRHQDDGAEIGSGVGFIMDGRLYAAMSRAPDDAELPSPGVVVYERDAAGNLPARWYHPDLHGHVGQGLSLDGPTDRYPGEYRAEYASSEGDFDPMIKEITTQGDAYHFAWRDSSGTVYTGIGLEYGRKLVAAWSTPRDGLDVFVADVLETGLGAVSIRISDPDGSKISSEWHSGG